MPEKYERMRDAIYAKQKVKNLKAAKKIAAMNYNAHRGSKPPVTRSSK